MGALFLYGVISIAQQATFKVAHSCDSASITDELWGEWYDTNHPEHSYVFAANIAVQWNTNNTDLKHVEDAYKIVYTKIGAGGLCEFGLMISGFDNFSAADNGYLIKHCRAIVVNTNILILEVDGKANEIYRKRKEE